MLTSYIQAAMRHAVYEIIDDPKPFYGEIPECQGVWANGKTLEECRQELKEVLEGWLSLGLRLGHPIPEIDGLRIESGQPVPIAEDEDEATVAAIDRGIRAASEGRVAPADQARRRVQG